MFDQNAHGRVVIQRDARAIDRTQARRGAGNFRHQSRFPKTHFTDTLREPLITCDRTDAPSQSGRQLTKRGEVFQVRCH